MGASVGTDGDGKSVDVELNVVPFIDLLSCLTAFLLVTAVWSQFAQLPIKPKGLSRNIQKELKEPIEEDVKASMLITESEVWVGLSIGDRQRIPKVGEKHDWELLKETLTNIRTAPVFQDKDEIEVAAEDDVEYQVVITAMDVALEATFEDIGFVDPASLTVKFKE